MDDGFTEHSGCPVYEGEKKIVTQWIRLGVDNETPWDSFNTRESLCSNLITPCVVPILTFYPSFVSPVGISRKIADNQ